MKILRPRNFLSVIYALLILMPVLDILARVCYTLFNKNAFESYSADAGTLDNVFEYAVTRITANSNLGNLNFFTWFSGLFLDLSNSQNALYVNYINWYFNYALLVSSVYILFLALMWFINWVRKLLEKGMDFGNRSW